MQNHWHILDFIPFASNANSSALEHDEKNLTMALASNFQVLHWLNAIAIFSSLAYLVTWYSAHRVEAEPVTAPVSDPKILDRYQHEDLVSTPVEPELQIPQPPVSNVGAIVDAIALHLNRDSPADQFEATGREHLQATITGYVERGETMELLFPGFPFKSNNRKKVLGVLPDLAEEMLLLRLEALARAICEHHPAGAVILILSDSIVYQAIPGIGQPDAVAYRYGAELRRMIFELGLTHITLVSAQELQGLNSGLSSEASEEEHIAALSETRARLLAHTVSGYDLDAELKFNVRSLETYLRYMKLLEAELDGHPCMKGEDGKLLGNLAQKKIRKHTARVMLGAGLKFSDIINIKYPRAIRISCHAQDNAGPRYAFNMFPGATRTVYPWHNVIMMKTDGSYVVDHFHSFYPQSYEVVHRYGRPYYLRERSTSIEHRQHEIARHGAEALLPLHAY